MLQILISLMNLMVKRFYSIEFTVPAVAVILVATSQMKSIVVSAGEVVKTFRRPSISARIISSNFFCIHNLKRGND